MGQTRVVIVADMGELKAFRIVEKEGINRQTAPNMKEGEVKVNMVLDEIRVQDYIDAHKRKHELVSDKDGNFKGGTGEAHNAATEKKKRHIHEIAEDITAIIKQDGADAFYLAFPKENCAKLKEALAADVRGMMTKCVDANLVKTDKNKILSYFS